ncbi:MAG: DUF5606 domain-containing protein [Lewinellaceae bacterium]|nr:DUF5606 domain-containing protein [Lewinellaceae bacterium]
MNLDKFLVIAGMPGVHKLLTTRSNGLLIEDRKEGRTRFVATRQNQITPLGTVAIYVDTDEGTVPLADVFQKMLDVQETIPPVPAESNSATFRAYFDQILPEHDRDRVHINDIKKCIKWFNFMQETGIFEEVIREAAAESETPQAAEAPAVSAETETPENTATT